jgi:hypothetical protein
MGTESQGENPQNKMVLKPGMVGHACNSSTREAEAGGS